MTAPGILPILLGSLGGALLAPLLIWSRDAALHDRHGSLRRALAVLGCGFALLSMAGFAATFGLRSAAFAATATLLLTQAVALLHAAGWGRLPRRLRTVSSGEVRWLRREWTGVPAFGRLLRATPLRALGGHVFLSGGTRDFAPVLKAMEHVESLHATAALCGATLAAVLATSGATAPALTAAAVNLGLNVLPTLHLRLARGRLLNTARRRC